MGTGGFGTFSNMLENVAEPHESLLEIRTGRI